MNTKNTRKISTLSGAAALALVGAMLATVGAIHAMAQSPGAAPVADGDGPKGRHPAPANFDVKKADIYYGDPTHPNISGFWRWEPGWPLNVYYYGDGKPLPPRDPSFTQPGWPFKPAWGAVYDARRLADSQNRPYGDSHFDCWPNGMYRDYINGAGMEITQTPGRVQQVFETGSEVRRIYTDGRPHLTGDELVPSAECDSVGHWEGDTLVVDTIGVRREFSITANLPHSSKVHFIEHIRRIDATTLNVHVVIEDPVAYTQPVSTDIRYKLWLGDRFTDDFCVENNRNKPDANLVVQYDLSPRKHYGFDLPPEE